MYFSQKVCHLGYFITMTCYCAILSLFTDISYKFYLMRPIQMFRYIYCLPVDNSIYQYYVI